MFKIVLFVLYLFTVCSAQAQENKGTTISLLTCSPGEEVWAQYGHTAIRWRNDSIGRDVVINYGMFSSQQPYFIPRFILGLTDYQVGIESFSDFYMSYSYEGRGVIEQVLDITEADKARITKAIENNLQPENRVYRYNFFKDNCTTRARDILLHQLSENVYFANNREVNNTYRTLIHRWNAPYPLARFGEDMLLGIQADQPLKVTEQQFLPELLQEDIARASYMGHPLVSKTKIILTPISKTHQTFFPIPPLFIGVCLFCCSLLVVCFEYKKHRICRIWDILLMLLSSIPGLILTIMIFSQHPCVNINLLLFLFQPLPLFFMWKTEKNKFQKAWWIFWLCSILLGCLGALWQTYPSGIIFVALSLLTRPLVHLWSPKVFLEKMV